MQEIKCPKCNRKVKLIECVSNEKDRKRMMVYFPCYHFSGMVYNVPCEMDDNTILKEFKSDFQKYSYYPYVKYLNLR